MAYQRKYTRGATICDMETLLNKIRNNEYVFFLHKPMHPLWVGEMPLNSVMRMVREGYYSEAVARRESNG